MTRIQQLERPQDRIGEFREETELDITALVSWLWSQRWYVFASVALFLAIAAAYAWSATVWYRAEVILAPAERKVVSQGSMGALGSLAGLAGIDLGGGGANTQAQLAVLKSRGFAREFITEQRLMPVLLAQAERSVLPRFSSSSRKPDIRDAVKFFDSRVRTVDEDRKTGLITMSVAWTDADVAASWANLLVQRINERLRGQELAEATRNLDYLKGELTRTQVAPLQQSLSRMIEGEMQKLLLARGNNEFAFKVIDPAVPPRDKASPRRTLILAGAGAVGIVFGLLIGSLATSWRRKKLELASAQS